MLRAASAKLAPAIGYRAVHNDLQHSALQLYTFQGLHSDSRRPGLEIDKGEPTAAPSAVASDSNGRYLSES
jgi:hypothetical protein